MKRRLLKYFSVAVLVIAFTGYFAFSTFLFSPTEDDFESRISTLIPRDVDFYVAKPNLGQEFGEFPRLTAMDAFEATTAGATLFKSPEWQALRADLKLAEVSDEIQRSLEMLPIEISPLEILGGRDFAVAGYFVGTDLQSTEWAVYARGNWMSKLGLAGLQHPSLLDLESQGLSAVVDEDVVSLSGGQLPRTLHLKRHRDVIVATTNLKMLSDMDDLIARSGEDSFGGSARYFDFIEQRRKSGEEAELFVDYRALSEAQQFTGRWPDTNSEDWGPAFLGRLFQSGALKEMVGVLGFNKGVSFDFHGALSSELVNPFQKQVYRERGFDRDQLYSVAKLAPLDTGLFAYLHIPLGATLRQALLSSERALQDNLNDTVRDIWSYPDAQPLIEDLDKAFDDRAVFILRSNDYPEDVTGPPHDDTPVFAWALVLWVQDQSKVDSIRLNIKENQARLGIQGREPGATGMFTNEVKGGHLIHEYWSGFIPGTGHLASVTFENRFILSNSFQMLGQLVKTFYEGAPTYPRLADEPRFEALVGSSLGNANLAVWVRPESLASTLRAISRRTAEDEVVIDWSTMRGQIDRRVLRENFPDWDYDSLSAEQESQLELLAEGERDKYERELRSAQVPALQAKYERQITYFKSISGLLVEVGLDPKNFELSGRMLVPLEE